MHPHDDEQALIRRAQREDQGALGELYERYAEDVYRFMFYRTGDGMVAEDLTAEVFTNVLTAIYRYRDQGVPFKAWLFRIARARLADYWRNTRRREKYHVEMPESEIVPKWPTYDTSETPFVYENLAQALEYLTDAERDAVLLRFAGGLTNAEVATVIHSNANAVKSKVRRALKKMKRILEQKASFANSGSEEEE